MAEITEWSAVKTAKRIKSKDIGVAEVIQAHLDQIAAVNPKINAITAVNPDAMDVAKAMDNAPDDQRNKPLFGVPVTTKINIDQTGFANSNGVTAMADNICAENAPLVDNLTAAGAVVVGRTNTPELSLRWCTSNPIHGTTLNPWDDKATPGGSSGGAAAAVACGIGAVAHGNDLGGSLRYPAYCCGVASIKPSTGRVPAFNPSAQGERPPLAQMMSVQGPIARSVEDVRLGLKAMSARSAYDPLWSSATSSGRTRRDQPVIAVGLDAFGDQIDAAVVDALRRAEYALTEQGCKVVHENPPEADHAAHLWGRMLYTELDILTGDTMREACSADMLGFIEVCTGLFPNLDLAGYLDGLRERHRMQRAWSLFFDRYDAVILPTSLIPPFENNQDYRSVSDGQLIMNAQRPLFTVNFLGLPSVAVPTGVCNNRPLGVQIIGAKDDDGYMLDLAGMIENQLGRLPLRPYWA